MVATLALVQLYRYRRISSPLERQQTKWVVFGLAVPCAVLVGGYGLLIIPVLADTSASTGASYQLAVGAFLGCTLLLIPLSFGFAMLRYRLWDIDILIRRTLVYGTLTIILALIYFGLISPYKSCSRDFSGRITLSPLWSRPCSFTHFSGPCAVASRTSLTSVSTVASMMPQRSWRHSAPRYAMRWI
jgi:hypothetical protein